MADEEHIPGSMDADEHRKTYHNVMNIGGKWGTASALALTMFFTGLVLTWGALGSFIAAVTVFFVVAWIAQTFFMH